MLRVLLFLASFAGAEFSAESSQIMKSAPDLAAIRWQNRVLLVFASDKADPELEKQKRALEAQSAGLVERDLKVFEVLGHSADNDKLRNQFGVARVGFAVVLIGKDGSRKFHASHSIEPAKLFGIVDTMPMRREEMRRSGS